MFELERRTPNPSRLKKEEEIIDFMVTKEIHNSIVWNFGDLGCCKAFWGKKRWQIWWFDLLYCQEDLDAFALEKTAEEREQ